MGSYWWRWLASAQSGSLGEELEAFLCQYRDPTPASQRASFVASFLSDLLRVGGSVEVRDSRLRVAWPDWTGPSGRDVTRKAMRAARETAPLQQVVLDRLAPFFAPAVGGEQLARIVAEGRFDFKPVSDVHPTGPTYVEAFDLALRFWSMPYRGRTGRNRRFVLTVEHESLGGFPVVAGILELGDEAPFCTWRDDLLGLSPKSFVQWLQEDPERRSMRTASRLRELRSLIRDEHEDHAGRTAETLVQERSRLEAIAHGVSRQGKSQAELARPKRAVYALRLARGEKALLDIANGSRSISINDSDLNAGVRALHDLVLTRVHMEATILGALPPFSEALGGKLLAAFLAHPYAVSAPSVTESEILGWVFDLDQLRDKLPGRGALCLTTKGLYAGHAPIYNRAETPGVQKPVKYEHLDDTAGNTTSLLSSRTARFAWAIASEGAVSKEYGSGGAKRHRALEAAAQACRVPLDALIAGISRPVYGIRLANNPTSVCWLQEEPDWRIKRDQEAPAYRDSAVLLWRERWLARAVTRVHEYAHLPGLIDHLQAENLRCQQIQ